MDQRQWQKVEVVFEAALQCARSDRTAFVVSACAGDEQLQQAVQAALHLYEQEDGFLDAPILPLQIESYLDAPENAGEIVISKTESIDGAIGSYRLLRTIGQGGMGTVYLAERSDQQFQRQVAVKLIAKELNSDLLTRRFYIERQILADLDHPNIARLLDGGTTADGRPYLIMDYIRGLPIDQYCSRAQLGIRERLELFLGVCSAVQYAHSHHVIHRDIKPSNILVTEQGVPKLLDFGIAKILTPDPKAADLTQTAMRVLTPNYASPEQIRGEAVTTASDVYMLGVVLYELLTGQRPFEIKNSSLQALERLVCETQPELPSKAVLQIQAIAPAESSQTLTAELRRRSALLAGDLDTILLKALRKEPDRRYSSVAEFAQDIRRHLDGLPVLARKDSLLYRSSKLLRRYRESLSVAALAAMLTAGVWVYQHSFSPTAPFQTLSGKSVAVLPFENTGSDPNNRYFSDGIATDITTELGKIAELTVISSNVAQYYKNSNKSLREIAQELGVSAIVTGDARLEGGRVHIVAQLINPQTEAQLWAEHYDRKFSDIFTIQADIASQIASTLQVKLSPQERSRLGQIPPDDLTAYNYFLQGNAYRRRNTRKYTELAIDLYKRALQRDPEYARAYDGLAAAYVQKTQAFGDSPAWLNTAIAVSRKALNLDPDSPHARNSLGEAYDAKGQLHRAAAEYRRIIASNPNYYPAIGNLAGVERDTGHLDSAMHLYKKRLSINPATADAYDDIGFVYWLLGEDEKAKQWLNKALSFQPDYSYSLYTLSVLYLLQGENKQAQQMVNSLLESNSREPMALDSAGYIEYIQGHWPQADGYLKKLIDDIDPQLPFFISQLQPTTQLSYIALQQGQQLRSRELLGRSLRLDEQRIAAGDENFKIRLDLAAIYAIKREKAKAQYWLDAAIHSGFRNYRWLTKEPIFKDVLKDPESQAIVATLKAQVNAMRLQVMREDKESSRFQ
ncbi:protein kinase domain-containing protein [Gloeobacter kilaueensis]|uniref:Serine/threonine protein kinase n=1 Tax=Gloeobacter kilaueensis (strain ATCC BAA-2537 / CCAP 1431/1 / ULC 316 / JS1) TaxID=1183438 RepID=U5QJC5_GLOK1|nr:protein kinase [Gloeobacter kilaueensis]AGY59016.1 serine/threonine protein kinase [Gloeobacter kilaueensis JS1]